MSIVEDIFLVREYIDDKAKEEADREFSDDVIEKFLLSEGGPVCAAKMLWQLRISKLGKDVAKGIKKSSIGVESHEFQGLKDQIDYYKEMYKFYNELCTEEKGNNTSALVKATQPSVAGITTEDELNELVDC